MARSKAWLQASASKVAQLISQALLPLLPHPRTAVRVAVATGMLLPWASSLEGYGHVHDGHNSLDQPNAAPYGAQPCTAIRVADVTGP